MNHAKDLNVPLGGGAGLVSRSNAAFVQPPARLSSLEHPRKVPSSISVVFPAFNEEDNIADSIACARQAMSRLFKPESIEIIVVDDGSTDRTRQVLQELTDHCADVVAIHHARNRGYGAALRSGLYAARNELVFFSDADLQFDLDQIRHLLKFVEDYDIVAGYRVARADPPTRLLNAWGWNLLVRLTLRVRVRDIDCAFKLFRREIFQDIHLTSVGAMINTELLALATRRGYRIKEVPVSHYPRTSGEQTGANPRVIIKAFRELWAMHGRLKDSE